MKPIPYRHRPKGLTILYEDRDILVVDKSAGLLTVKAAYEREKTAHHILTNYIRKGSFKSTKQLFVVHRLDRDTSGVLVFAKSPEAKENLKLQWKNVKKKYVAVVHGILAEKSGTITSYLAENEDYEVFSVKDSRKGELAKTRYKVITEAKRFSLLEIELLTGKKNQIRVHFSEKGHPLVGDDKYGKKDEPKSRLALHSHHLTFRHPHSGKELTLEAEVPGFFKSFLTTYKYKRNSSPLRAQKMQRKMVKNKTYHTATMPALFIANSSITNIAQHRPSVRVSLPLGFPLLYPHIMAKSFGSTGIITGTRKY